MEAYRIVVVGGNNVDITATSLTPLVYGDSNPGNIRTGLGGVGRNIAENLTRLGQQVKLLTVFGDDEYSALATTHAEKIGIDISDSLVIDSAASCIYVCINNPDGEMSVAVNDMQLCNHLTPAFLAERLDILNTADAIVLDANIPEESIDFIAQHCHAPIFADAVSSKKVARLHRCLPLLTGLKANQIEMELLTGMTITHEHDMVAAANMLHQMGVELVLITLGSRGAFASDGNSQGFERPFTRRPNNTTGCGDAFLAAAVLGFLSGTDVQDILRRGLAAASICSLSELAVSEQMSMDAIAEVLQNPRQQEDMI